VLDLTVHGEVKAENLHETDYSPWEGHPITAWPCMTLLRGKVMVEDGRFFGDLADGQYIKRTVPQSMREAPAL